MLLLLLMMMMMMMMMMTMTMTMAGPQIYVGIHTAITTGHAFKLKKSNQMVVFLLAFPVIAIRLMMTNIYMLVKNANSH